MSKRSVFFKIGLGFVCLYAIYSVIFFVYYANDAYSRMVQRSFEDASNYLRIGRVLLKTGDLVDLTDRMSGAIRSHEINYFLIRKGGENLVYENSAGTDDPIEFPLDATEGMYETDSYRHFAIIENGYELIVGHKISRWAYLVRFMERDRDYFLKDVLFVSLLVLGLAIYSLRDLLQILGRFSKLGANRSDDSLVRSKEALQLVRGLKGYENKIQSLSQENTVLRGQVLPALQKELWSGRVPPYDFGCTMVRTDINNFTSIFSGPARSNFMEVINEFFVDVTHIVSRYKGFIYEFIGDEVIFYFKDEDHQNSMAIAISAVRDINRLAEQVSEKTHEEQGYSFRIKSSLSYGLIRFGPLVNGFSLAGSPLIETVRILSHVHDKSGNTILFDETVRQGVSFLCSTEENKVVMLKGLAESRRLHSYRAHVPLSHHLRQKTKSDAANATYYRSDQDICEILNFLKESYSDSSRDVSLELLGLLRSFRVTKTSTEIKRCYISLLEILSPNGNSSEHNSESFILSSVLACAPSLFGKTDFKGGLRDAVMGCLTSANRRIVANAIDVFAELDPDAYDSVFEKLMVNPDNRIVANSLVKEGKRNWNERVARRLTAMIKGQSPYFKASGLYALGEIALYLRKQDEVAFRSDRLIHNLLDEIPILVKHANRMVRRQAMLAASKADRLGELSQFESNNRGSLPPDLSLEIRVFLSQNETAEAGRSGSRVAS